MNNNEYETKSRFISYYNQYKLIKEGKYKKILEIGISTGTLSTILKKQKIKIITADINKKLNPDIVLDLNKRIKLKNRFDCIVLFQTLEHIPYKRVRFALKELFKATDNIIISIPIQTTYFYVGLKIPLIEKKQEYMAGIQKIWSKKILSKQHKWELGTKEHNKKDFIKELEVMGIKIKKEFQDAQNPYHLFLELRKVF